MFGRKTKFEGKKTKWEKRRIARLFARAQQLTEKGERKKPLVDLLTIASEKEREYALKKNEMVFYDGNKRIELPLSKSGRNLIGVYKIGLEIVTLRMAYLRGLHGTLTPTMEIDALMRDSKGFFEMPGKGFFFMKHSLGHMLVPEALRGSGLALKGASKAERHVRATRGGEHSFEALEIFKKLFTKLGYEDMGKLDNRYCGPLTSVKMKKIGKFQPKDNLDKFYRIEAIDPKNGKARLFTFPIK